MSYFVELSRSQGEGSVGFSESPSGVNPRGFPWCTNTDDSSMDIAIPWDDKPPSDCTRLEVDRESISLVGGLRKTSASTTNWTKIIGKDE
jgi:hypothetical protein